MKAQNYKTGCFIVSRTSSKRLPNKILKLVRGKSIIQHIIERAKLVSGVDIIVLCTSTDKSDDVLESVAKKNNIKVFRGSLKDVLARYLGAAERFGVEAFAVFSGDNVFTDPGIMGDAISQLVKGGLDFINIPDDVIICGGGCYCISTGALKKVCQLKKDDDTEIIAPYFLDSNTFKTESLKIKPVFQRPEIRLTLDYPEDLELIRKIFDEFDTDINDIPLERIIKLLDKKPDIININSFRRKDWASNQLSRRVIKNL